MLASLTADPISTHALREEGDTFWTFNVCAWEHFYPRPPRGGRRPDAAVSGAPHSISTHALREEGDLVARL